MWRRMMAGIRSQAVGYVALFVALGGTALAATGLPAKSVGTRQLKNRAVTGRKVARHTLTGANINLSKLGKVPNAARLGGVLPAGWQRLVSGSCSGNSAIVRVNWNGTVVCHATGSLLPSWQLTGNAGTDPSKDYLGTSDNQSLSLDVNAHRALELQPNATSPNLIGGYSGNTVSSTKVGATIGGGGESGSANSVTGDFGAVTGGQNNSAGNDAVSGGIGNLASGNGSTAFGSGNTASGNFSGALGINNLASGIASATFGSSNTAANFSTAFGIGNAVGGSSSTAAGFENTASGSSSVVMGQQADDPGGDDNSFVWSDGTVGSSDQHFSATGSKQFDALASGGFNMQLSAPGATYAGCKLTTSTGWSCTSDRNAKRAFRRISDRAILTELARMPIASWAYKLDPRGTRHIGPTAQAFKAAFHVGDNPRLIGTLDEGGVALASIKGLYQVVQRQQATIKRQQEEIRWLMAHAQRH